MGSDVTLCINWFFIKNIKRKNIHRHKETLSKTTIEWKPFPNILFWNNVKYSPLKIEEWGEGLVQTGWNPTVTRNSFLWQEISLCIKKFSPVTRNFFL